MCVASKIIIDHHEILLRGRTRLVNRKNPGGRERRFFQGQAEIKEPMILLKTRPSPGQALP